MNIVRLTTAGSVDDGKSTFIGRLLFDTKSLPKDKLENIKNVSEKRGLKEVDLSLITDGLSAEREQGITIDVAHIYFSTKNRKYIIADTPGHIEYTRNMITGASNSDVFMILIDARNGIVEQTKRHLFIASLMRMKNILFIVNKMDLVDFDQEVYKGITKELEELRQKFDLNQSTVSFFPISAKLGDNVATKSENTPWYDGKTVLSYLEELHLEDEKQQPFRFNVQYVIRPHNDQYHDFRGYAGKVVSGQLKVGDEIKVASTGQVAKVSRINRYKAEPKRALKGDSIVVELEKDIDTSRGDLFVKEVDTITGRKNVNSKMCWLGDTELNLSQKYLLRRGAFTTQVKIDSVKSQLDFKTLNFEKAPTEIKVNSINEISLKTATPLFMDAYEDNPNNGSYILVDPNTNATVAVGFLS